MKTSKNIIIACTGSVATIRLPVIVEKLLEPNMPYNFNIKVVCTNHSKHFFDVTSIADGVPILDDQSEWNAWQKRGDPVVHIDLGKWADLLVIAPLSANSLAKITMGICDNLLLCMVRAWDLSKPVLFCPAMNTRMYEHPITLEQIEKLKSWGYREIPCIPKTLMCGDTGNGAMAEVKTIVDAIIDQIQS